MDTARKAAAAALANVHGGGYSHLAAKEFISRGGLSTKDRSFANAIFYGTAERLRTLDYILAPVLPEKYRPLEKLDVEVRAILETGLYQIHYMRVPSRSAVSEAVDLTRAFAKGSAAGLVNAVLRHAADVSPHSLRFSSEQERVEITYSVSAAVAACLMAEYPDDYERLLHASFQRPGLFLRANTLKVSGEELVRLLERDGHPAYEAEPPGGVKADLPGGVDADPLFKQGMYHVQGAASQFLCAYVAAGVTARMNAYEAAADRLLLDLCAAPGGKAATIAELLGDPAGVTLCDKSPTRLALARELFTRLGLHASRLLENDATVYNPDLGEHLAVLCDVPCSGLGVLAQKPDLRYTDGSGFAALPEVQFSILQTAARYVPDGGLLFYSTCTIRRDENSGVVSRFLSENSSFRLIEPQYFPEGAEIKDKMMAILPHKTGLDGFFIACMEKV